jgi:hypothetical protein
MRLLAALLPALIALPALPAHAQSLTPSRTGDMAPIIVTGKLPMPTQEEAGYVVAGARH